MVLDIDLVKQLVPEPISKEEKKGMEKVGLGDYEIYSEKLNLICAEGREVMTRTGVSGMIHSGDLVIGIYTKMGDLVTASLGTYLHIVTGQIPCKFIMKFFKDDPTVGVKEGDIFYGNEAVYGGIHNPDQFAIMPIFYKGKHFAWAVAAAHQTETGACEPGGMPVTAKSRYDEGMKLTPIRIGENYQIRNDMLEMMANMCARAARMQVIDVKARATGADRVRVRLQELAEERGLDFLMGIFRKMIKQTEEGIKSKVRGWNDGVYRHTTFFDSIGVDEGLIRVCATVTKKGDRLIIDFTGTSPENEGSWNGFLHTAIGYSCVYMFGYPFHDVPVSSGLFNAIEFKAPRGIVLNANVDAAVANAVITCHNVWQPLAVIFSKMMFDSEDRELVGGITGSAESGIIPSGVDQWGVAISDLMAYPLNSWGFGARVDKDGIDCGGFQTCPWGKGADVEDVETEQPHLHLFQKGVKDTCGHGKFRGGLACETTLMNYAVPTFTYNSNAIEAKIPSQGGVFGGYPGTVHPGVVVFETNALELLKNGDKKFPTNIYEMVTERKIKGKYLFEHNVRPTRVFAVGEIFHQTNSGGGGYGDSLERDPELIIKDLKNQAVSDWTARAVYFVDYDPDTMLVNHKKTKKLREKERKKRIKLGKKHDEFLKTWLRKKPPARILKYYGSWPNAEPNREIVRI